MFINVYNPVNTLIDTNLEKETPGFRVTFRVHSFRVHLYT